VDSVEGVSGQCLQCKWSVWKVLVDNVEGVSGQCEGC